MSPEVITKIEYKWIVGILLLLIILRIIFRRRTPIKRILPLAMAMAGFSLMASEITIIYAFQVFYGYLYYKIGLIITALMTGMAVGTWLGAKKISQIKIKSLVIIHGLIIIFCLIFLLGSWLLFKTSPLPSPLIEIVFLILAALVGGIIGFEFPIVNKLYLEQKSRLRPSGFGGQVGVIYGADLIGSCLGASLISIFILPIFGIFQTLILLALLNVFVSLSLYSISKKSGI